MDFMEIEEFHTLLHNDPEDVNVVPAGGLRSEPTLPFVDQVLADFIDAFQEACKYPFSFRTLKGRPFSVS